MPQQGAERSSASTWTKQDARLAATKRGRQKAPDLVAARILPHLLAKLIVSWSRKLDSRGLKRL